jgi:hypothetical protein
MALLLGSFVIGNYLFLIEKNISDDDTITLDDDFLEEDDQPSKTTSIPIASYFILVTELCERFAYYGIVAVLQVRAVIHLDRALTRRS